jgi:TonB family protein
MRTVAALIAVLIFTSGLVAAQEPSGAPPNAQPQATPQEQSPPCQVGSGVKAPRITFRTLPKLTPEEQKTDKVKSTLVAVISLTVSPEGKPQEIKVTKSLGHALDKKAIDAVNTWKFDPATKDCKPIAVRITAEVTFELH